MSSSILSAGKIYPKGTQPRENCDLLHFWASAAQKFSRQGMHYAPVAQAFF